MIANTLTMSTNAPTSETKLTTANSKSVSHNDNNANDASCFALLSNELPSDLPNELPSKLATELQEGEPNVLLVGSFAAAAENLSATTPMSLAGSPLTAAQAANAHLGAPLNTLGAGTTTAASPTTAAASLPPATLAQPQTSSLPQPSTMGSNPLATSSLPAPAATPATVYQSMHANIQPVMIDTGQIDSPDINAITATTRGQANVTQWGPVSVSQSAPVMQQAHELLSPMREQLRFQIDQKIKHAEMRLDPPELGKVQLNIRLDGDKLHIQMHAANANVRDALMTGLDRLRADLAMDHGGQIDVDISHGDTKEQSPRSPASASSGILASHEESETLPQSTAQHHNQVDLLA